MHAHANVSIWQRNEHEGTYSAELNGCTLHISWQPEEPGKRRGFRWKVERDGKDLAVPDDLQEEPELAMAHAEAFARSVAAS
jgi:hypothetical protein